MEAVEVVYIEWEDAFTPADNTDFRQIEKQCLLQAAGIVCLEDEHRIVIASDYSAEDNNGRGMLSIPKMYIRRLARVGSEDMKYDTVEGSVCGDGAKAVVGRKVRRSKS